MTAQAMQQVARSQQEAAAEAAAEVAEQVQPWDGRLVLIVISLATMHPSPGGSCPMHGRIKACMDKQCAFLITYLHKVSLTTDWHGTGWDASDPRADQLDPCPLA